MIHVSVIVLITQNIKIIIDGENESLNNEVAKLDLDKYNRNFSHEILMTSILMTIN
jgi:hypothetical protein